MNRKASTAATAEAPAQSESTGAAIAAHHETRELGVALQRAALRLAELGHMKAGGEVLRAAVRLSRVRPGQVA